MTEANDDRLVHAIVAHVKDVNAMASIDHLVRQVLRAREWEIARRDDTPGPQ